MNYGSLPTIINEMRMVIEEPENITPYCVEKDLPDMLIKAVQLFYNGLVLPREKSENKKTWKEQERTLDNLLKITKKAVICKYKKSILTPSQDIKKHIEEYQQAIIKHGSDNQPKINYLETPDGQKEIKNHVKTTAKRLRKKDIDTIIPIVTGGFEPGLLLANKINADNIFPIRYSHVTKNDKTVLVPVECPESYVREQIENKTVLVVDDVIDSGKTFNEVAKWLQTYNPKEMIFTASRLCLCEDLDKSFVRQVSRFRNYSNTFTYKPKK